MTSIHTLRNYSRGNTAVESATAPDATTHPVRGRCAPACGGSPSAAHGCYGRTALFAALLVAPTLALAAAGQVTHLSGPLFALGPDGARRVLAVGSEVNLGDTLITEARTYARVKFADQGDVTLRPDTQLKVERYAFNQAKPDEDSAVLGLFKGALRSLTGLIGKRGNKDAYRMNTATATIGIRGTHFGALLCQNDCGGVPTTSGTPPPNGLHVDVTNGAIVMSNGAGSVLINTGQFGFVANSGTLPVIVPPQQGIQVTVPSSISQGKGGAHGGIGKGQDDKCTM